MRDWPLYKWVDQVDHNELCDEAERVLAEMDAMLRTLAEIRALPEYTG